MMKFYKRSHVLWSIFILGLIVQVVQLTFVGCSHTSPYYHPDIPTNDRQDFATENALHYRVLLLGDGGQPKHDEPVLKNITSMGGKIT